MYIKKENPDEPWLLEVLFNSSKLIPVVVQDYFNQKVLMLAWMNKDALFRTVSTGVAIYWSRSRQKLWKKGEQSGHFQFIKELYIDCDNDSLLLRVVQKEGIACHTGHNSCFFRKLIEQGTGEKDHRLWMQSESILKRPELIYDNEKNS